MEKKEGNNFIKDEKVEEIKKELEKKVNPKSIQNGISKLTTSVLNNDNSILLDPMKKGSEEFKLKTGRNMTYSEMREMWG
jgi:hypothetical protein